MHRHGRVEAARVGLYPEQNGRIGFQSCGSWESVKEGRGDRRKPEEEKKTERAEVERRRRY